jgi:UrcA family protein
MLQRNVTGLKNIPFQNPPTQQETVMLRALTAAALLVLCADLSVGAARADDVVKNSVHVSYGDLNLTSSSDDKILASRLAAAAKTVCAPQPGASYADSGTQACMSSAVSEAISRIQDQLEEKLRTSDTDMREAMANP